MRLLVGLLAVVALAGCGSVAGRSGVPAAPFAPLADAPPIQAVDEAPPEQVQRMLDSEFAPPAASGSSTVLSFQHVEVGVDTWSWGGGSTSTTPTPAELAQLRAELDARRVALEPAPDSPPRVVARLPLEGGGDAVFVAWHNRDGLLCTEAQVVAAYGGGGGGPAGPCANTVANASDCAALCLTSSGSGKDPASMAWLLSGTVAADADALDVTTADGPTTEYPLTGPFSSGTSPIWRAGSRVSSGPTEPGRPPSTRSSG